jgi:hypothetical protein
MTHGFFLSMGGFVIATSTKNVYYPVTPEMLDKLIVDPIFIASIPAADLMDRSSSDPLFLFLAFLQGVWFVSQIVGRWISGMEVTQLEVVTLAILGMSSLIVGMLWKKPRGVNRLILLPYPPPPSLPSMLNIPEPEQEKKDLDASSSQSSSSDSITTVTIPTTPAASASNLEPEPGVVISTLPFTGESDDSGTSLKPFYTGPHAKTSLLDLLYRFQSKAYAILDYLGGTSPLLPSATRVPLLWSGYFKANKTSTFSILGSVSLYSGTITGILFGAIHFSAWNAIFPSSTEETLWKMCCVAIVVLPAAFACLNWINEWTFGLQNWWVTLASCTVLAGEATVFAFYLVCRAVMLVLPLMQLRALPEGAFVDLGWSRFIPHIG